MCTKDEGVRDYFHVAAIGYGGSRVASAFAGSLQAGDIHPISEVALRPSRVEDRVKRVSDGAGGLVEARTKFPIWIDPVTDGGTPMCAALHTAHNLVLSWLAGHPDSFPPVILNLTDGQSTDGDPRPAADAIQSQVSSDGNALLFNLHVSERHASPVTFPATDQGLPDDFARTLFTMSSVLPPGRQRQARELGYPISDDSRGFVYNADIASVVQFLDIGTRVSALPSYSDSLR
jgi:hypothetical protein